MPVAGTATPARTTHALHRRRALAIAALPSVAVLVVGGAVAGATLSLWVAVAVVVVAVGGWAAVWRTGPVRVLRGLGTRPVDEDDVPRAANLVEGLCASMGVPIPQLYIVDSPARGALAVGRGTADGSIVLTSGLLDAVGPVELEAVLAHELAHLKSGAAATGTMALAVMTPLAPLVGSTPELVHRLAGRGRELAADGEAVRVTRYPPGLRDALVHLRDGPPPAAGSGLATPRGRAGRWLWTVALPPAGATGPPESVIGELDSVAARISVLEES